MATQIFIFGSLGSAVETAGGGMRIPARISRSGILEYEENGKVYRDYQDPSELFSDESLASLKAAPVTIGHPAWIDSENWEQHAIGHVSDLISNEEIDSGKWVVSELVINRSNAIEAIRTKQLQEVSAGYQTEIEEKPGRTDSGEEYDRRHTQIRFNHVGLGPKGWARAGKDARILIDGKTMTIKKIKNEGDEEKDAKVAELEAKVAELEAKVAELEKKLGESAVAKKTAEDQLKALEAKTSDSAIQERVNLRLALEREAATILGSDFNFDGKSDLEIRKEVVAKAMPGVTLDGLSDSMLTGMYVGALVHANREVWAAAKTDASGTKPSNRSEILRQRALERK